MRMAADAKARSTACKHSEIPCEYCVGNRRSRHIRRTKPECMGAIKAGWRRWRENLTPEKEAEFKAKSYERSMAWRKANPERHLANTIALAQKHPERQIVYARRWTDRNRDHVNARVRQRKAWKKGLQVGEVQFDRIWDRDGGICQICGVAIDRKDPDKMMRASMDHIVTLAQKGAHCEENIDLAHRRCNYRKRNRSPWQLPPGFYWSGRPNRPGIFHISAFDKPEIACAST